MTITYPLTTPTSPSFKRVLLSQRSAVGLHRSQFTYQTQVQEFQGQMWVAEITLPLMKRDDAENWHAFLLKLNGQSGTFYLYDPLGKIPRGAATGTPLVMGAQPAQRSYLVTDGWNPNVTNILKAGDYFQLGTRLYKNLSDVNSDASGIATFDIFPRLREAAVDNDVIITNTAKGIFRMASSDFTVISVDEMQAYEVSFSAIEAI